LTDEALSRRFEDPSPVWERVFSWSD